MPYADKPGADKPGADKKFLIVSKPPKKLRRRKGDRYYLSRWTLYLAAIAFGIVFSITLVSFAWHNALESNKLKFSLEAAVLENTAFNNIRTAHDALNSLATFVVANQDFDQQEFDLLADAMLEQLPHIEGMAFFPFTLVIDHSDNNWQQFYSFQEHFPFFYQTMRSEEYFQANRDMAVDERYQEIMPALASSKEIITVAVPSASKNSKDYWLFKRLRTNDLPTGDNQQTWLGLAGILVKTDQLLGQMASGYDLSLTMLNNAVGLSGRPLLYQTKSTAGDKSWVITSFTEGGVTQFPLYSIKLAINKKKTCPISLY